MPPLEFSRFHSYSSSADGISLPVTLRSGDDVVDLLPYSAAYDFET